MRSESFFDLFLRLLWFYFVGLWAGGIWMGLAWFACLTVIGLPVGVWMTHQLPLIMTLKGEDQWQPITVGGKTAYVFQEYEQSNFLLRAIWFVCVGWWASFAWFSLAGGVAATWIGIPVAFWMFNQVPFLMTLRR